ncbi:hypothetical protein EU527_03440 [Candidatus Thorarchaeota archaeon]|nr:MAG: hypothetical protein EU527_03440 [Candidatus Thorarchaeota archaeon]
MVPVEYPRGTNVSSLHYRYSLAIVIMKNNEVGEPEVGMEGFSKTSGTPCAQGKQVCNAEFADAGESDFNRAYCLFDMDLVTENICS